ncbi:unnamed protein product [Malus baccata var. baccata]
MSNRNLIALLCHGGTYSLRTLIFCLIALLCHEGVLKDYFMELLMKDQENTRGIFCNRHAAAKVALSYGGMDDAYNTFKMMSSYIPLEESYLQHF